MAWVLALLITLFVALPSGAESTLTMEAIPSPGDQTGARFNSNQLAIKAWSNQIDSDGDNIPDAAEAFGANPANCTDAGDVAVGVTAAGIAEDCIGFDDSVDLDFTFAAGNWSAVLLGDSVAPLTLDSTDTPAVGEFIKVDDADPTKFEYVDIPGFTQNRALYASDYASIEAAVTDCGTGDNSGRCLVNVEGGDHVDTDGFVFGSLSPTEDKSGLSIVGLGSGLVTSACTTTFKVTGGTPVNAMSLLGLKHGRFGNLCIDATGATNGLFIDATTTGASSHDLIIENVYIYGHTGCGILIGDAATDGDIHNIEFRNVRVWGGNNSECQRSSNAKTIVFQNSTFQEWQTVGLDLDDGSFFCDHCTFLRTANGTATAAVDIGDDMGDVVIRNVAAEIDLGKGIIALPDGATTRGSPTVLSGVWAFGEDDGAADQVALDFHHGGTLDISGLFVGIRGTQTGADVIVQNDSTSGLRFNNVGFLYAGSTTNVTFTPLNSLNIQRGPTFGGWCLRSNDGVRIGCFGTDVTGLFVDADADGVFDTGEERLGVNLSTDDGTQNQAGDPVSWSKLKDVPSEISSGLCAGYTAGTCGVVRDQDGDGDGCDDLQRVITELQYPTASRTVGAPIASEAVNRIGSTNYIGGTLANQPYLGASFVFTSGGNTVEVRGGGELFGALGTSALTLVADENITTPCSTDCTHTLVGPAPIEAEGLYIRDSHANVFLRKQIIINGIGLTPGVPISRDRVITCNALNSLNVTSCSIDRVTGQITIDWNGATTGNVLATYYRGVRAPFINAHTGDYLFELSTTPSSPTAAYTPQSNVTGTTPAVISQIVLQPGSRQFKCVTGTARYCAEADGQTGNVPSGYMTPACSGTLEEQASLPELVFGSAWTGTRVNLNYSIGSRVGAYWLLRIGRAISTHGFSDTGIDYTDPVNYVRVRMEGAPHLYFEEDGGQTDDVQYGIWCDGCTGVLAERFSGAVANDSHRIPLAASGPDLMVKVDAIGSLTQGTVVIDGPAPGLRLEQDGSTLTNVRYGIQFEPAASLERFRSVGVQYFQYVPTDADVDPVLFADQKYDVAGGLVVKSVNAVDAEVGATFTTELDGAAGRPGTAHLTGTSRIDFTGVAPGFRNHLPSALGTTTLPHTLDATYLLTGTGSGLIVEHDAFTDDDREYANLQRVLVTRGASFGSITWADTLPNSLFEQSGWIEHESQETSLFKSDQNSSTVSAAQCLSLAPDSTLAACATAGYGVIQPFVTHVGRVRVRVTENAPAGSECRVNVTINDDETSDHANDPDPTNGKVFTYGGADPDGAGPQQTLRTAGHEQFWYINDPVAANLPVKVQIRPPAAGNGNGTLCANGSGCSCTPEAFEVYVDRLPTDLAAQREMANSEEVLDQIAATWIRSGSANPPALCPDDRCIYLQTDVNGAMLNIFCAVEGEAFDPCSPGFSAGSGTDSPNGNVTCDEALCLYAETDAEMMWVSWTLGDSGWKAVDAKIRERRHFTATSFATATLNGRCLPDETGLAGASIYNCVTTVNLNRFSQPAKRSGGRLKKIACYMTTFVGEEAGDSVAVQALERNGVDSNVTITDGLVIDDSDATGVLLSAALDEPITLTDGDIELMMTATDANDSITDLDATCFMEVEYP